MLDSLPRSTIVPTRDRRQRLIDMAGSVSPNVRAAAASNPMLPKDVLINLSQDENLLVRSWVARNPKAPKSLLLDMAGVEPNPQLRAYLNWLLDG